MWVKRSTRQIATDGSTSSSRGTASSCPVQCSRSDRCCWMFSISDQLVVQTRPSPCWVGYAFNAGTHRRHGTISRDTRTPILTGQTSSSSRFRQSRDKFCGGNEPPTALLESAGRQSARSAYERRCHDRRNNHGFARRQSRLVARQCTLQRVLLAARRVDHARQSVSSRQVFCLVVTHHERDFAHRHRSILHILVELEETEPAGR